MAKSKQKSKLPDDEDLLEEEEVQTKSRSKAKSKSKAQAAQDEDAQEELVQSKSRSKSKSRVVQDEEEEEALAEEPVEEEEALAEEPVEEEEALAEDDFEEPRDDEELDAEAFDDDAQMKSADVEDEDALATTEDEDADASTDDAADPDEDESDEEEKPSKPSKVKAKVTKTTILFILLNWIAVPAFLYCASLDLIARLQYAHRTTLQHVAIWGLPLKSEEDFPSLSNETRPKLVLSAEQLNKAFKSRKNVKSIGKDEFVPVDEPVPLRLRPSDLTPRILADIFPNPSEAVATLEAEIDRLKTNVPVEIGKAAAEAVAKLKTDNKTDDDKRKVLRDVLMPIAWDARQVERLEAKILGVKGEDLDKLLDEGIQRRLYYDILAPINLFKPGDLSKYHVEKIADLDAYDLDAVKGLLKQRFEAATADRHNLDVHLGKELWDAKAMERDSVEKRQKIGFIMFTLAHVQVPAAERKLYPKGVERAQLICGLREFTTASIFYVRALRMLEDRNSAAVFADRDGVIVGNKDKLDHTKGFADVHDEEVDRLVTMAEQIDVAKKRLEYLKTQRDQAQKIYAQRDEQVKEATKKVLAARKNTEKYVQDLRELQLQLHTALVELSDAAERNFTLEARIRSIELDYLSKTKKKGKKLP